MYVEVFFTYYTQSITIMNIIISFFKTHPFILCRSSSSGSFRAQFTGSITVGILKLFSFYYYTLLLRSFTSFTSYVIYVIRPSIEPDLWQTFLPIVTLKLGNFSVQSFLFVFFWTATQTWSNYYIFFQGRGERERMTVNFSFFLQKIKN